MNTAAKLTGYAAVLALVATAGWGLGAVAGPDDGRAEPQRAKPSKHGGHDGDTKKTAAQDPAGLASTANGYTFAPATTRLPADGGTFAFRILGQNGKPVKKFAVEHEKRMHLIVVRRDTSGFQHVHPTMAADGTWRIDMRLPKAGSYRAFADFAPEGGDGQTLGVDLSVAGNFEPVDHPVSRTATVDGYEVTMTGDLVSGRSSEVTLRVRKDGRDVTDLEPYLGAYGHLVALRTGDLAYLHVHPEGEPGDGKTEPGPEVTFAAEVPSADTYRLFLDFKHDGEVRTADFTLPTRGQPVPKPTGSTTDSDDHDDEPHGHGD
ncbi:MAG: hypothetical protein GEV07_19995 [Streptosporangiales bacterium]|nr:hypothetical protein [Streptosporangiales bacterium]